jgi:hypothetical protein
LARLINFDIIWLYNNLESSILDAVERSWFLAYLDSDSKWYLFDGWHISSACLCQWIWTLRQLFNPTQMAFNQEAWIFEPSSKIWYTSGCTFQHISMNWSSSMIICFSNITVLYCGCKLSWSLVAHDFFNFNSLGWWLQAQLKLGSSLFFPL